MKNRSSYAVLTRFGIIAAILATLVLIAPVATATTQEYTVDENTTDPIARFTAADQEGDEITWGVEGDDNGDFVISDAGVLSFKEAPNYESPADADTDNVYMVTVTASGKLKATQAVQVTVMDVDEAGKVSFGGLGRYQPQVDRSLTASLTDPDTGDPTDVTWQWSRGPNVDGPWTDIAGATNPARDPAADDIDHYLRATATYNDKFNEGEQKTSASAVSENPVEVKTVSNAAPKFPDAAATRMVDENVKGNVGKPLGATDSDPGDILHFTITDGEDKDCFSVDPRSGQLMTSRKLDFENAAAECTTGTARTADDNTYEVTVTATDPSGASAEQAVVVTVEDVNDAPTFAEQTATASPNAPKVTVVENATPLALDDDGNTGNAPTYTATDQDPADTTLTYAVTGADSDKFFIAETTGGALALCSADNAATRTDDDCTAAHTPDFEKQSSYSISITADDGNGGVGKVDVTVAVTNANDPGTVSLTQREPQIDRPVTASLEDPDGSISNLSWQWYWNNVTTPADQDFTTAPANCDADSTGLCTISGANSPTYTPKGINPAGDKTDAEAAAATPARTRWFLTARATYNDKAGSDDSALATPEKVVQPSNPANTAPMFAKDNDPNTPGDQGDVERSVPENKKDESIGAPVTAESDPENDLPMYTLSGDDASSFKIGRDDGQITTAVALDYEMKSSYTIVVTATDPSGATGSTNVNITVTDADDPGEIVGEKAYTVDENTSALGSYTATDQDPADTTITWGVSGDDADKFSAEGGVLMFKKAPSYEDKGDADGDNVYKVNVTANKGSFAVEVTVEDVDEPGKVTLDQPQPQVSRAITADGADSDPDKPITEAKWQWSSGPSMDGPWTDIAKATSNVRTVQPSDEGLYLRATVTYNDKFNEGDQTTSASAVSENPVEPRTLANAAPKFPDGSDAREVNENANGANVGKPVAASDADAGDILLYTLADGSTAETAAAGGAADNNLDETTLYKVDERSGQITTSVAIDVNPGGPNDNNDNGDATHTVIITATDPSGASTDQTVTITVKDINDAPKFLDFDTTTADVRDAPPKTLYVTEIATPGNPSGGTPGKALRLGEAATTTALADSTYTVNDDDTSDTAFTYSLEGADAGKFHITPTGGVLTVCTADATSCGEDKNHDPDYEKQKSYSITIIGMDNEEAAASIDVTVMVVNAEDAGTVKLNRREPQVDQSVVATLNDPDGSVTGVAWRWYWDTASTAADATFPTTPCDENSTVLCLISGATSPSYTPTEVKPGGDDNTNAPDEWFLTARATYTDGFVTDTGDPGDDGDAAHKSPERDVQAAKPDNSAPAFPSDTDPNVDGNQDTYEFTVPENKSGEVAKNLLHSAVAAEDDDEDLLLYSLSGADAESFTIVSGIDGPTGIGTIKTAVALDYETKRSYTVIATATDPSGASDSITVNIMVTDVDDAPNIEEALPPAFDAETAEFDVEENSDAGTAVGTVTATDPNGDDVAYSLDEMGDMYFDIDAMGQITVGEGTMLDYESDTKSYSVTVTATDPIGLYDMIAVTIMVTDVEESPCVMGGAVSQADSGSGLDMDCQTLLAAMDELIGDGTGTLNWSPDTPIRDWDGLGFKYQANDVGGGTDGEDSGRVLRIYLKDAGLSGQIPDSLNELTALRKLTLSENDLTGGIPDLSDLDVLTQLILSDNNLSGEIPATLGDMAELDYLYLHRNDLSGSIPAELGDATRLRRVYLHGNGLTGEIPTELGNLSRLRNMILSSNMLTGEIPAELADATNLKLLYLDNNMLTGSIPAELGSIMTAADDTLRRLYLNNNMLSGDVPAELGNLANLMALRLSGNDLTGCIPAAIIDAAEDAAAAGLSACE